MAGKTWREHYAPKIAEIIKENEGKDVKELRRILTGSSRRNIKPIPINSFDTTSLIKR